MEQFEKLGLSKEVLYVLKEAGFTAPSEIQEKTIPLAIAGKDIIGGSATGSGKTLVFAVPIIENLIPNHTVQSLILTPTRELAEQVAVSIKRFAGNKRLNVLSVYGGVNIEQQIRKLHMTDVVVGTPGRILDHLERRTLDLKHIKILVLDEVDRMFDMGFFKDVETILRQCPTNRQTMMFSATISADVFYLAKKYTKNPIKVSAESYVDASKLKQIYYDVPSEKKFSLFVHLLKEKTPGLAMVFCSTRRNVDFVAKNLIKEGINVQAIHGGLTQNNRTRVLNDFQKKNIKVMICTDVAGRGLDIKGVTYIYNYNLPKTSTDYIHRIGRTARAGEEGKVINLLSSEDYMNFSKIKEDDKLDITEEKLPEFKFVRIEKEVRRGFSGRRNLSGERTFSRRGEGRNSSRNSGRSNSRESVRRNMYRLDRR
jgi:ATP-dependent RNA helicase DeaD